MRDSTIARIALLSLIVAGASTARPLDGDTAVEDAVLRSAIEAPEAWEVQAIYLAPKVAARKDNRLTLRFANGTSRTYIDAPNCVSAPDRPRCAAHALVAYLETRKLFVMAHIRGDTTRYSLVDRATGVATDTDGPPIVSPNGDRALVFDPNKLLVTVLRRTHGRFAVEWTATLGDGGRSAISSEALGWRSSDVFRLRKTVWSRAGDPKFTSIWSKASPTSAETVVDLRRANDKWTIAETPAQPDQPRLRWNWRATWLGTSAAERVDPSLEPGGVTDVLIGTSKIKILSTTSNDSIEFAGFIAKNGAITGVEMSFGGDAGPALMVGQYNKASARPGYGSQCALAEIVLRDGMAGSSAFPNGAVTTLVKQQPEECRRGLRGGDDE